MTFTFKQKEIGRYAVAIEQEKFESCFHVRAYESYGEYCHRIKDNIYGDEKDANRRFNYLVRLYTKEMEA